MENNIILSICIPTYNRVENLRDTIFSIVTQRRFKETNDVEIVILDNGSTDDTSMVIDEFAKAHGEKIRWYRKEKNDKYLDLKKLFSSGTGDFLKFNNDTLKHNEGSLDKMIQTICDCKKYGYIPFFSTGEIQIEKNILCKTVDSFVQTVSYWTGWMGAFGIWRDDFVNFKDFDRYLHLQLPQVDILFRLINSQRFIFINNEKLFFTVPLKKKGGYDLLTVFLDNYIFLLTEQLNNKTLSKKVFVFEKRKLLLQFIRPWLINIKLNPSSYYFECKNSSRRIIRYYKEDIFTLIKFIVYFNLSLSFNFAKKVIYMVINKKQNEVPV
jgi:glycosyltransferase involved in cell wall biosynthesis